LLVLVELLVFQQTLEHVHLMVVPVVLVHLEFTRHRAAVVVKALVETTAETAAVAVVKQLLETPARL
jgi:hypothetical protein